MKACTHSESLIMYCRPTLKKEMEFCEQSPEEVEKVAGLRQQVAEVKNVMLSNIDAVRRVQSASSSSSKLM